MENVNPHRIETVALLFCGILLLLLGRLIMRRRLREEYILVWCGALGLLLLCVLFREHLDELAHFIGVYYAPSLLFLIIFGAMLVYSLHLSVTVSGQEHKIKELAQKIALLEAKTEKKETCG
jgi:hypothetical protein